MKNTFIGSLSVILAALMWGCVGIITRALYSFDGMRAIDITFARAMFTVIILFVILIIFKRDLLKIKLKHIPIFLGSGIASFLFFNYCYMSSINENSLSVACILMYTSPVWVTIISAFAFKEKITAKKVIALVLALGGCALVSLQGETKITTVGLVYGILSGIGYALYTIFGRIGVKHYSSITVTFYTFVFATLGGLPFAVTGKLPTLIRNPSCLGWCMAAAVFSTVIPYLLYTFGLTKIQSSTASIISIIEPVMATVVGFFAFDEKLTEGSFFGILTVVFALVLLEIPLKLQAKKEHIKRKTL